MLVVLGLLFFPGSGGGNRGTLLAKYEDEPLAQLQADGANQPSPMSAPVAEARAERSEFADSAAASPAPAVRQEAARDSIEDPGTRDNAQLFAFKETAKPQPVATAPTPLAVPDKPREAPKQETQVAQMAPPDETARAITGETTVSAPALAGNAPARLVQRFTRFQPVQDPGALPNSEAKAPAILASFQWEQSGAEIRIVDRDGSVYTGHLLNEQAEFAGAAAPPEATSRFRIMRGGNQAGRKPAAAPAPTADRPVSQPFRVSGTNASLKQSVVFSGNLLQPGGGPQAGRTALGSSSASPFTASRARLAPQPVLPPAHVSLTGTVKLEDGREYPIQAMEEQP
jgi:hypothetical protein